MVPPNLMLQDMSPLNEVCSLPFAMYCSHVVTKEDGSVESFYERSNALWMNRSHCATWPSKLTSLRVIRSQPLEVPKSALGLSLGVNLIRQCCTRSDVGSEGNDTVGTIWLGSCGSCGLVYTHDLFRNIVHTDTSVDTSVENSV